MKKEKGGRKGLRMAGRRRFLAWNAFALLSLMAERLGGHRPRPGRRTLKGREARWYRRID